MGRKKILLHKVIQAFVLELEQLQWLKENAGGLNQSVSAFLRDMIEEVRDRKARVSKPLKPSLWQRILKRRQK